MATMDTASELCGLLGDPPQDTVHNLIHEYLIHNCYGESARVFGDACQIQLEPRRQTKTWIDIDVDVLDAMSDYEDESPQVMDVDQPQHLGPQSALQSMASRKKLLDLILKGSATEAIEFCDECFPNRLSPGTGASNEDVLFELNCQQFIEFTKQNTGLALEFAQKEFGQFAKKYDDQLQDILALIAYPDPTKSPLAAYLTQARRETVATMVNEHILASFGLSKHTSLEKVIKHATVLREVLNSDTAKDKRGPNQKIVYPLWNLDMLLL